MASSITTNADLLSHEVMIASEIERLTTPEARNSITSAGASFPWRYRHEQAWSRVVRDLLMLPNPIAETDLSDPTQLTLATCFMVAALAYSHGESAEDKHRQEYFKNLYDREMAEAALTLAGGDAQRASVGGAIIARRK